MNESAKELYLSTFLSAANSATPPGFCAAVDKCVSARVCDTVTYHVSGLPDCQGMSVTPSGLLPSVLLKPDGSLTAGLLPLIKARWMTSFRLWWRLIRPVARLHERLCRPEASTSSPQGHACETQRLVPSRRPTGTRTASSSSRRPQAEIGKAFGQSPLCSGDTAVKRH